MINENAIELREVILRLASDADDHGLTQAEIAALIGLLPSCWPMDIPTQWAPGMAVWQEARLRDLGEVMTLLGAVFGADAPFWLRRANVATGLSPLNFLASDGEALRALRDVLRSERGVAP